jgi:hypothetical protein
MDAAQNGRLTDLHSQEGQTSPTVTGLLLQLISEYSFFSQVPEIQPELCSGPQKYDTG